ncbi:MAG: PKD domain-containing protein [Planctomycetales bacterium]|nr:PKD domain-containing protein [bacterium]UNM07064.1 MAG: PKD domain-containing protein [Planctomycetales bacterium]
MNSSSTRIWAVLLLSFVAFIASCGGGGTTTPNVGSAFSLFVQASTDVGPAPLAVTFDVVPSGGVAPYTYAWDFDDDGVTDSNAATGRFTFTQSSVVRLTVTDNANQSVSTSKTITVTDGGQVINPDTLRVTFEVDKTLGNVPFNVQFTSRIEGGKAPYQYAWDFNGDGEYEDFTANPLYTYTAIGELVGTDLYLVYPVLRVIDSRGIESTNLADNDNNGEPDFRVAINALPPNQGLQVAAIPNPSNGQAPLLVEFTGVVSGGSGNYEYRWEFGDNSTFPAQAGKYSQSSIVNHTYVEAGEYKARILVRDASTQESRYSEYVSVVANVEQPMTIEITADESAGQVPFVVNFEAKAANGSEPIIYNWDVFNDANGGVGTVGITNPPSLVADAIVTPHSTTRKSPAFHFANTGDTPGATFHYAVRCVAVDALGNTAASNIIRVTANPRTAANYYSAVRPPVAGTTFFDVLAGNSKPKVQAASGAPWSPRANAAVTSHKSGLSFIMGGELTDEFGNYIQNVLPGDSAYMFMPESTPISAATGSSSFGKFNLGAGSVGNPGEYGGNTNIGTNVMLRLNDGTPPSFPGQGDRAAEPDGPAQSSVLRGRAFEIVGSAAAVFVHENPESNPDGSYWEEVQADPMGHPNADHPMGGFGLGVPGTQGLGVPLIYVMGGRVPQSGDLDGAPVDLVQRYEVFGFGAEDLPYDSFQFPNDGDWQMTSNQTDIWSTWKLRPDLDQVPRQGANEHPPVITARQPDGASTTGPLPTLPKPLYGLAATSFETGADVGAPSFPDQPFSYVFIFGGVDENGSVTNEMRWWDTALGQEDNGGQEREDGVFSLLASMPSPRAYATAVPIRSGPVYQIALVGGVDQNGVPVNSIDIFTFDSGLNPNSGSWETFEGAFPEALEACGAGYRPAGGQDFILAFGGWTGEDYSSAAYSHRYNANSTQAGFSVREPLPLMPRSHLGSSTGGSFTLFGGGSFNSYQLFGGVDENGVENVVETFMLP